MAPVFFVCHVGGHSWNITWHHFFGFSCFGKKLTCMFAGLSSCFLFCFQFYPGTAGLSFFLDDDVDFSLSQLPWLNRFIFSMKYLLFIT